jgi:hypothetical protein
VTAPGDRTVYEIRDAVGAYYGAALARFGTTPRGVDWNSAESQALRFAQLLRVAEGDDDASLIDYGCGYGALVESLAGDGRNWRYQGFDICESMIEAAKRLHGRRGWCSFSADRDAVEPADYAIASGIFNVKLHHDGASWRRYVFAVLDDLASLGRRGFAFNALSTCSDAYRRRGDLFYADPLMFFQHCQQQFSRRVALLHDSPLCEFTIIVRTSAEAL